MNHFQHVTQHYVVSKRFQPGKANPCYTTFMNIFLEGAKLLLHFTDMITGIGEIFVQNWIILSISLLEDPSSIAPQVLGCGYSSNHKVSKCKDIHLRTSLGHVESNEVWKKILMSLAEALLMERWSDNLDSEGLGRMLMGLVQNLLIQL